MSEAAVASITQNPPAQAATPAKFIWYDLMTTDTTAATAFYHDVIGWEATDSHLPGHAYTYLSAGPTMVSGLMELPAPGLPPGWMGYIGVDDVDAYGRGRRQGSRATAQHPPCRAVLYGCRPAGRHVLPLQEYRYATRGCAAGRDRPHLLA